MFPLENESVRTALQNYPSPIREKIMVLREIILTTASQIEEVGEIEETLKWGEPAYLTSKSGSGSTIRLAWKRSAPTRYRMLFNCQTSLVDTFRTIHPDFNYDGNRAIVFEIDDDPPRDAVIHCVEIALTYHRTKRARQ
jgi:hypothetical protein